MQKKPGLQRLPNEEEAPGRHALPRGAEQARQTALFVAFTEAEYFPAGQRTGQAEPIEQYPPRGHGKHTLGLVAIAVAE